MTISGCLISCVRHTLIESVKIGAAGQVSRFGNNSYSPIAIPVFGTSVAALESFVNETLLGDLCFQLYHDSPLWCLGREKVEWFELLYKIQVVPQLLFGKCLDKSRQPFQDLKKLVHIRNDIIHYKSKAGYAQHIVDLVSRGIALSVTPGVFETDFHWVQMISGTECIRWAHNTVCNVVHELTALMPDNLRSAFVDHMASGFTEISERDMNQLFAAAESKIRG